MELALAFLDRHVVDAGEATGHQAVFVELPVFVAVGAEPVTRVVVPFIGITHGNAVAGERPEFLDQPVVQLLGPFAGQEALGLFAVVGELGAVAPLGVQGVGQGHALRVARVPAVFGQANFFNGRFTGERG
ncbi:hypothetical protein D3C86_1721340 [compost metagenome]